MAAYYDSTTKETVYLVDGQRLTIPDYMTIEDIAYFIGNKQLQSTLAFLQQSTYNTPQESPLETARSHYKNLGWFKDTKDAD